MFGIADRTLALDIDHAVATFGRHVEHEIEQAVSAKTDAYYKSKAKNKQPPSREQLQAIATEVWNLEVRRMLVREFSTAEGLSKAGDLQTGKLTYRVEKDLNRLTGNPVVDRDIWKNSTIYWSNGKVEECGPDGTRVVVSEAA